MAGELLGGLADRLVRLDGAVGPDFEDQLVPVGFLADTGLLDQEIRLDDRAENRVDRDDADWLALFLVALGGHVALTALDREFHPQAALVRIQRTDIQLRVDDLDVAGGLDVRRLDFFGPGDVQRESHRIVRVRNQVQALEIENDLRHVLFDVRNRREFVRDAFDRDGRHGGAFQRAQQHPAQRVAQGGAEPGLERLDLELAIAGRVLDALDLGLGDIDHGSPWYEISANKTRRSVAPGWSDPYHRVQ